VTLTTLGLLSTAEIRTLIAKLMLTAAAHPAFIWAWSRWRRHHQAIAAMFNLKKRTNPQL